MRVRRRDARSNIQEESHQDIWMSALWWSHSHLHLPHPGFKQPHRATSHALLPDPDGMLRPESQLLSLVTSFWELTLHALVSFQFSSYSLACPPWPPPALPLQPPSLIAYFSPTSWIPAFPGASAHHSRSSWESPLWLFPPDRSFRWPLWSNSVTPVKDTNQ